MQVLPGQVVALVGPSGGGKSTIVNLIEKFYDLDSGQILLGGHNLQDLDPKWFRKHMSVVSQEPVLFACSIADNIKFGQKTATPEEVGRMQNCHVCILCCFASPSESFLAVRAGLLFF